MSDQKDSGIKLFGRVIPLFPDAAAPWPPEPEVMAGPDHAPSELQSTPLFPDAAAPGPPEPEVMAGHDHAPSELQAPPETEPQADKDQHKETEDKEDNEMNVDVPQEKECNEMLIDAPRETEDNEMGVSAPQAKEDAEQNSSSTLDSKKEDQDQLSNAEDKGNEETEKAANDESGQDKVLKKPDKIIPCPRCNSMDTKFCYYNNYNVNQPRHFCKKCQRYWTAGGTMRNVPVGAGRRKSKNSSLHYRHLMMAPDSMMGSRVDIVTNTVNPEALASLPSMPAQSTSRNETVLKFGQEVPLCESMASVLNIEEQNVTNARPVPQGENREDNSCASSITSYNGLPQSAPQNDQNGAPVYCNGVGPPPQYYLGAPFMYPWSIGWNNLPLMVPCGSMPESTSSSEICSTTAAPWMNSPMIPGSRHPAPSFPLVPPALWGCLPSWPATAWNAPWINGCHSPSASSNSGCSSNGSPTLGKHSRDTNPLPEDKGEKSLWVPKTLRIVDPDEAAKSSIWATLGIKPGNPGVFKPFQLKDEGKAQTSDAQPAGVLHANPAAFSRLQSLLESS